MLAEKYRPKSSKEIIEQKISEVIELIKKNQKIIIYGPPGVGKTSCVYAIASDLNYEVIEINASDERSKSELEKYIPAVKQKSIFGRNKIILIDEIDGISNTDYGAIEGIKRIIKESIFPVVLTANDIWDKRFKELRSLCKVVEFNHINKRKIFQQLKKITQLENIQISDEILEEIADGAKGDLRAALNDLNAILYSQNKSLEPLGRELEKKIVNAILTIIYKNTYNDLSMAFSNVELEPEEILYWVEHSIWNANFSYISIQEMLKNIQNANYLLLELKKNEYWRMLVYIFFYLSVMVGKSKKETATNFKITAPNIYIHKWNASNKQAIKNALIEKISKITHANREDILMIFDRYIEIIKNSETIRELLEIDDNLYNNLISLKEKVEE
ncbi:MAG: AAA family ATPase [Candidatus Woesearchaeota archaeon]